MSKPSTRDVAMLAAGAALAPRQEAGPSHVTVKVKEERAPTDESVRLLKEMEQAATDKVIAAIPLTDTAVDAKVVIEWMAFDMAFYARAVFSLNGTRMEATAKVDSHRPDAKVELMRELHDAMARKIATEILRDGIKGMRW